MAAEVRLSNLTSRINEHLRHHHTKTSDECEAVMGAVGANMIELVDEHFSVDAEPTRVSEMLLFHVMFSG